MSIRKSSGGVALALALTILVLGHTSGVRAAPVTVRVDPVDISDCPRLKAFVVVEDGAGKPVKGLTASAFGVVVAGQAVGKVDVKPFDRSGEGLAVALVLDTSGSMSGATMTSQTTAASAFIGGLKDADRVAVVTFGNQVRLVRAFTKNAPDIRQQVESLAADSTPTSSRLFDGIYKALEKVRDASGLPGRRAVVVISDGKDKDSTVTLEDCQRLAKEARCPVHSIGFSRLRGNRRRQFLSVLERLSRVTGGTYQEAPEQASLTRLYMDLARRLKNRYVLRLTARGLKPDGKSREIRVSVTMATGKAYKARELTVPVNHRCPPPPAPPPPPPPPPPAPPPTPMYRNPAVLVPVAAGALMVVVLVALLVRRRRRRRELEARRCTTCDELRPEGSESCPNCDIPSEVDLPTENQEETLAQLVVLTDKPAGIKGHVFEITEEATAIGRKKERCQILLPDREVSLVHAEIILRAEGFEIHDLDSGNGTFLNGDRVSQSKLKHSDELELGSMRFKFFDRRE